MGMLWDGTVYKKYKRLNGKMFDSLTRYITGSTASPVTYTLLRIKALHPS